jgi:hypothetical protein
MADQKSTLGVLAFVSFLAILFTPQNTEIYKTPLLMGILFGALWFFKK